MVGRRATGRDLDLEFGIISMLGGERGIRFPGEESSTFVSCESISNTTDTNVPDCSHNIRIYAATSQPRSKKASFKDTKVISFFGTLLVHP
jgi:hypothetical protein